MTTGRVVGLIAGEGENPDAAIEEMKRAGYEVVVVYVIGIGVGPRGEPIKLHLIDQIYRHLCEFGVQLVAHIGDLSLMVEQPALFPASKASSSIGRQIAKADTIEKKLRLASGYFQRQGMQPVHVTELVPAYRIAEPGAAPDWLVPPKASEAAKLTDFVDYISDSITGFILRYEDPRALRRTTIYDQSWTAPVSDLARTHAVLERIIDKPKRRGSKRALVKVGIELGMECTFEAPVFGRSHIDLCHNHGIDLVVLNSTQGVLAQPQLVLQMAREKGIAIWAMPQPHNPGKSLDFVSAP